MFILNIASIINRAITIHIHVAHDFKGDNITGRFHAVMPDCKTGGRFEINVAVITEQYMSYIDLMDAMQFELAAEYLLMASKASLFLIAFKLGLDQKYKERAI